MCLVACGGDGRAGPGCRHWNSSWGLGKLSYTLKVMANTSTTEKDWLRGRLFLGFSGTGGDSSIMSALNALLILFVLVLVFLASALFLTSLLLFLFFFLLLLFFAR